jgi:hypothetical protein
MLDLELCNDLIGFKIVNKNFFVQADLNLLLAFLSVHDFIHRF